MGFANVTVPFSTEEGYPREKWNVKGGTGEWKVRCAWADRYTLADQLATFPDDVYPFWFNLGTTFDTQGGIYPMFLMETTIEPASPPEQTTDAAPGFAQYPQAILTNRYTNINTYRSGSAVMQISMQPMVDQRSVSHWNLRWNSNGKHIGEREVPAYRNPMLLYKLVYLRATSIPSALFYLPGTVNQSPYYNVLLGVTFPAQSLLYHPGRVDISFKSSGAMSARVTQTCVYTKNYNPDDDTYGWNNFWSARRNQFEKMKTDDGKPYLPYEPADWSGV